MHAPIWEHTGNRLIVPYHDWYGETAEQARQIAMGASLVEGVLLGIKWTGDVMELTDGMKLPHVEATITGHGGVKATVFIISGPLFEKAEDDHA
jgi:hypothetical protein